MNPSDSPTPDSKYVVTPTGIQFNDKLSFEEWLDLGMKIAPIAKSIGFKMGDWVNYGSKIYGKKYKGPIEATGIPYQTLANYSRVARKVGPSIRQSCLCYEIHAAVAKLKPHDQKHWLDMATEHKLSVRRLKKSIHTLESTRIIYFPSRLREACPPCRLRERPARPLEPVSALAGACRTETRRSPR